MADGLYANAQIITHGDTYLLTRKRIREMAAATDRTTILRVLNECGYQTDFADDTQLLNHERQRTLETFCALCDDPALVTCVQALHHLTEANALATFRTLAEQTPHIKTASIRNYFTTYADLTNVRTFYKGGKQWVPGGTIEPGQALDIFPDQTPEQIETAIAARLTQLAAVDRDDIFRPNPLFWWYQQKQKEWQVVKIILTCHRLHYDHTILRASLRGLYEQFK